MPNIGAVHFDQMASPSQPQEQQHGQSPQDFALIEQYLADDFLRGDDQRENVWTLNDGVFLLNFLLYSHILQYFSGFWVYFQSDKIF